MSREIEQVQQIQYDDPFAGTKFDVMPTRQMVGETTLDFYSGNKGYVKGAVICTAITVPLALGVNPAMAQSVQETYVSLDSNKTIKGATIGVGVAVGKEFLEDPRRFINALRLQDWSKFGEIIGNAAMGGIAGAAIADGTQFATVEGIMLLSLSERQRLLAEAVLGPLGAIGVIATTDHIRHIVMRGGTAIRQSAGNFIEGRKQDRDAQDQAFKERIIKKAQKATTLTKAIGILSEAYTDQDELKQVLRDRFNCNEEDITRYFRQ